MKKVTLLLVIFLFVLSACREPITPFNQLPKKELVPYQKHISDSFFNRIKKLIIDDLNFIEISEWYNEDTILYLEEENGLYTLQKFQLLTGKENTFIEMNKPILSVLANIDYTLFAIKTSTKTYDSPLYIVDFEGNIRYKLTEFGEDFSIYWNDYRPEEMLVVSYLPNWDFDVYHLQLEKMQIKKVDIEQTFLQWLSPDIVGYLNWNQFEPSYFAPLYSYNLKANKQQKLMDEIISFFSFPDDWFLTITIDSKMDMFSSYNFFQKNELISQIQVPILNTYSDQWWVPFHTFDSKSNTFYFLRPYYSGEYFTYRDGFELVSFEVIAGKEEVLLHVDTNAPIHLSPNGNWLLYGYRYETLIEIGAKKELQLYEKR